MITCGRECGAPNDFGAILPGERVLMSLKPEYYELMWQGLKTHEFRRRYLKGQPTTWYVYLTAPVSKLIAVIDLGEAVVGPTIDR
ncbi:hypothetical protein [Kibdelosporangium aridum]|uniref:hypothetical protein n=1 Tax=Kibdelosporangium aridum TaxID=2030 RepID=UPI0021AE0356|nr:hypothetical protein [Kibdelosporangium aridum]